MSDDSNWKRPQRPDSSPIIELHRGHDGYVTFHRKDESGEFKNLFAVKASEIDSYFPEMSPLLDEESYFSINGFWRPGWGLSEYNPQGLSLRTPNRKKDNLRYLTAAFVDIDCYKEGIEVGTAIGRIINLQDNQQLPDPSMFVRSGQGLWVFWFLSDAKEPASPQRAWPEKRELWYQIQLALHDKLSRIGADSQAKDESRVTRVLGSMHRAVKQRTKYLIQADATGKAHSYTIEDLAKFLGLVSQEKRQHPAVTAKSESITSDLSKRGKKGQRGRWVLARRQFQRLWSMRSKFKKGTRNAAVFVYATILRSQRLPEDAVHQEVNRLYSEGIEQVPDRFTEAELAAAVTGAKGYVRFGGVTNQQIADWLKITPEESAQLESWPPASKYQTREKAEQLSRKELAARRRPMIRGFIERVGYVPTIEEIGNMLDKAGLRPADATIAKDLEELGIRNPRRKRRDDDDDAPRLDFGE